MTSEELKIDNADSLSNQRARRRTRNVQKALKDNFRSELNSATNTAQKRELRVKYGEDSRGALYDVFTDNYNEGNTNETDANDSIDDGNGTDSANSGSDRNGDTSSGYDSIELDVCINNEPKKVTVLGSIE